MYTLDEVRAYREAKGKKKLILDTNLLLLLLIGVCDKNLLSKYACTEKYTINDYSLLLKILRFFESDIVITPHILAEFSNLVRRDIKEPKMHYYLATIMDKLKSYQEEYIPLDRLLGMGVRVIVLFGFPDMSIIEAARNINAVILTHDIRLGEYANASGLPSISFGAVQARDLMASVR
ncbi:MAG: hypothetical protein ABR884_03725 [Minisyncoccia bacterium]